jgi:N-hydroxyarylamine O-acetyltransferase
LRGVPDVNRYLRRLGLDDPGLPTPAGLAAIHRAQVERVPYNTIDIHLGRTTTVDPYEAFDRVVATGRAGYCFHLNGALSVLLSALGYDVRWHRGGVWSGPEEVPLVPYANHLALTVHRLPSEHNPDGVWLVDAGLGDALHEPLPLLAGPVRQGPFAYRLDPSPVLPNGWRFHHDPVGSFRAMDFEPNLAEPADFVTSHRELSTSPESPFVRFISVQRRDAAGTDKLISATLRRNEGAEVTEWVLRSRSEWYEVLADLFGLRLDDADSDERDALWREASDAQAAWERGEQ